MTGVRLAAKFRAWGVALAAVTLLGGCSGALRTSFPTEEEARSKLRRDMSADEVIAVFGKPLGHTFLNIEGDGKLHYIAPVGTRTAPREGYAGFSVYLHEGRVWDWEIILLNPSYEHRLRLPGSKTAWLLAALTLLAALVYGAKRLTRAQLRERQALKKAYATSDIPTAELPPDFRFITSATTLDEVMQTAGPYSRVVNIAPRSRRPKPDLKAFVYDLPYRAAVFVMPEAPFEPQSRVRAVWFREPRRVREF